MTTDTTARVSQGDYALLDEQFWMSWLVDEEREQAAKLIATVRQEARLAAIEEAAKVAEDHGSTWGRPYHSMTDAIAAAIRNLSNEGMQG